MSSSKINLAGRTALVTGASRKLGAVIASELSRCGASVVVNYNESAEQAADLVGKIVAAGGQAIALRGDVGDPHSVSALLHEAVRAFGKLDILVNNAGPYTEDHFSQLRPETWDWIMNTNVRAVYYAAQLAYPSMKAAGWGRIVNISAGSAFVRNHSVYGLAKNALQTLTESLALEYAPTVTVNAIAPGLIDDPEVPEGIKNAVRQDTPLKRLVTYQEVAEMVCLICTSAFDTLTGQVLVMDGGQTIPRGTALE